MSSTHKISTLRSLATKVALGLGVVLVASSIAPMAVAPASALASDRAITSLSVLDRNYAGCLTSGFTPGQTGTYNCAFPTGSDLHVTVGVDSLNNRTANATLETVHNTTRATVGTFTTNMPSAITVTGLVAGDSIVITDVGGLVYTITMVTPVYTCTLNASPGMFSNLSSQMVVNNGVTLEIPVRANYEVNSWMDGSPNPYSISATTTCRATSGNINLSAVWMPVAVAHTQTFNPNGGNGSTTTVTNSTTFTFPTVTHASNTCTLLGWSINQTATIQTAMAGATRPNSADNTWYAVWSSASCRTGQQQNNAPAQPAPELDLSGLKTIPAPTAGVTGGVAGIDLKGKNLPVVSSVTVSGKDGKVVTSTDSALKLDLPTLAPGSYDIVMKTEAGGSITIQNGLVIAPPVDTTPAKHVVITPSLPRTTLVAASTPVPGFLPGKAGVSEAQKAIIQDVVLTKNVTSLECVGVTNAKVSAKLASARAASICAAAKAQNADLTTSVKTIPEAKVNGPIGSVLINYNH